MGLFPDIFKPKTPKNADFVIPEVPPVEALTGLSKKTLGELGAAAAENANRRLRNKLRRKAA